MKALGASVLGLLVGLVIVETVFWFRDDGAFPHANFYVADKQLGVRLRPGATQRFALGNNPLSTISINKQGLRGTDLGVPTENEILIVGDSQVFGLGVNDHETFAAKLADLTRRTVVNGGVPTYGPLEYNALALELIKKRKPKLVIYTVNMLNDLFEHDRPNTARHAVWDGWAVRVETAPKDVFDFPGRLWLFSQSHAVYALRRYLHGSERDEQRYASEGTWQDLVARGQERVDAQAKREAELAQLNVQVSQVDKEIEQATEALWSAGKLSEEHRLRSVIAREDAFVRAHPGDIVRSGDAESSRAIEITAEIIQAAVERRQYALEALAAVERENKRVLASAIKTREDAKARRRALLAQYRTPMRPTSVLDQRLRELRSVCDARGCEVLVVALPIDVQVSSHEWKKYGQKPVDMSATTVLSDDLLSTASALGMRTLDALPALRAAEPGAFLDGDIHMTAKGHAALAKALAAVLSQPAPSRQPTPGLPAGRTYPPSIFELEFAEEVAMDGAIGTECAGYAQDEWVMLECTLDNEDPLMLRLAAAHVEAGGHSESLVVWHNNHAYVMAPLHASDELKVALTWDRPGGAKSARLETGTFTATRAAATDAPVMRISKRKQHPEDPSLARQFWYEPRRPECDALSSETGRDVGCVLGDPANWPTCPRGSINGNAFGRCFPVCGVERSCAPGNTCSAWQGVDVCRSAL